jgi:hypothetical protein
VREIVDTILFNHEPFWRDRASIAFPDGSGISCTATRLLFPVIVHYPEKTGVSCAAASLPRPVIIAHFRGNAGLSRAAACLLSAVISGSRSEQAGYDDSGRGSDK